MSKLHPATRRRTLRMLVAVPYLLLPRSVLAAPRRWTITGTRVEEFDSLDAAMQRLLQRYAVRAGSLAVARQRKLLFARGYTWAEPDYPVTQADSPFRLASVSKAFTAAVIYQLLQAKKLELSLPVFPWLGLDRAALPGQTVDPRLATITVQQLINHRGGWDSRAANFDPVFSMRRIARRLGLRVGPSSRDIARFMVGEPLQFTPGTQQHYSNFGYVMLGLVAEKAGAAAFHDLVRDQVAAPLGIDKVFRARTRRDQRLPGEGFYDQPGTGLTPEFPDREVRVPLPYGGEGLADREHDRGRRTCRQRRRCRTHDRSLRGVGPGSAARQPELGAQRRHGRHQQPCDIAAGRTRPLLRREHPQFWRRQGDG